MSVKFIHAADLHIDSPMRGLSAKDSAIAEKVREATRAAFENLVDYAINKDNEIKFIIVAGDVFDGDWDDVKTGLWTNRQFQRLTEAGITVYLVYGNHDGKNNILRNMRANVFPSNVVLFPGSGPKQFVFDVDEERFAISGQSYANWQCPDNLAAGYPAPVVGAFNIGVLHTGLGGETVGAYAPTTVAELRAKGYDYWALGHQHTREVFVDAHDCFIAYSGVLQSRHINESVNADGSASKGFYVVEVKDGKRTASPEFVPVDSFRWFYIDVDLSGVVSGDEEEDEDALHDLTLAELRAAIDDADGRDVAARIRFHGRTSLYGELKNLYAANDESPVFDRLRQTIAAAGGNVWVEKFDVEDVKPMVPEDFWDKEALREIRGALLAEDGGKDAPAAGKRGSKTPKILPACFDTFVKKVGVYRSELLYGKKNPNVDERDPDGVDLDDPEQLRKWKLAALDVLADAFMSAEETGKK